MPISPTETLPRRRPLTAGVALLAVLLALPAAAQDQRRGWLTLGVTATTPDDVVARSSVDPWGLKAGAGFRLHRRWAIELAASHIERDTVFVDSELDSLDLSARITMTRGERWDLFLLAGPGWSELDEVIHDIIIVDENGSPLTIDRSGDGLTAHLGVGFELDLGERWFFRPEARQRWWIDGDRFTPDFDSEWSLGAGVRF